jgi:putative spermidine/putrescine transport system substrate-binding protein
MKVRKGLTLVMVLLCAGSLLFAAGTAEEAVPGKIGEGRTLVVGIWGGPQEELVREHVIKPFEEDTGATVELILGGSSDRFARLIAEKENPTMDVVYISLSQTIMAKQDGLILPPNPERVPEYNNLYDQAKEPGAYGVAFISVGLMVNTEYVDTMPESWADIFKPEYRGKVAPFVFPGTQGEAFLIMAARANGGDESNIDPGFEALKSLKPFPAILSGIDETNLAFAQGDVWFTPQMHGYVYEYKAAGGNVEFVIPKEGAPLALNSAAIPINSKNADLAEIFINYHLSQDCQQAYAEELYYAPTNKTVVLPEELASAMPYGEEEVGRLLILDNDILNEKRSEWTDRWNREILR